MKQNICINCMFNNKCEGTPTDYCTRGFRKIEENLKCVKCCLNCKYFFRAFRPYYYKSGTYSSDGNNLVNECRKNAPKSYVIGGQHYCFPEVSHNEAACGEFEI